jgi:hypothetical protein
MTGKTSMGSLPDEILQRIVEEAAGDLDYNETNNGYSRTLCGNTTLRALRLVNQRLSHIAQFELYRVPSSMLNTQQPLLSDHLQLLLHPNVNESAQMLSLAGTSAFFAGLLDSRFPNVKSLTLIFTIPHPGAQLEPLEASGIVEVVEGRALIRLRAALLLLPLRELYINFRGDFHMPSHEYFQCVLLGAGHGTLRHLSIESPPIVWEDYVQPDGPIRSIHATSLLKSINVRCFGKEDVQTLQTGLGSLPHISKLSIEDILAPEHFSGILKALNPDNRNRISCLTLTAELLPTELWQALAGLPSLRNLILRCWATRSNHLELGGVILTKLETLELDCPEALFVNSAILRQAVQRSLLPSLSSIHIILGNAYLEVWEGDEAWDLLSAYDELVAGGTGVVISPINFRDMLKEKLEHLNRNGRLH